MTNLEKYELVNNCETIEELQQAILTLSAINGLIQGRMSAFPARPMSTAAKQYYEDDSDTIKPDVLTRMWGIRQQAMYLKYYKR